MSPILTVCGGFLLAVLWMDLMFDVQVGFRDTTRELPEDVLSSIAAYYRRVTVLARPMSYAVGATMIITVLALTVQIARPNQSHWAGLISLPLAGGPILLAGLRVYPNAMRLGSRVDAPAEQSRLARAIYRDHLLCFCGISLFVVVQLWAARG